MAIKSVSELQYSVAPSTYTNLTLVPAEYIGTVLGINTYVSGTSYSAGNKVIHNGTVYVAGDGALGTPGASGSNWTATSVSGLLGSTYTAGTNISIANNQISCTYELPEAGAGTNATLGGVRLDNSTIKWSGGEGAANVIQVDAVTSGGTNDAKGKIVKVASDATTIATSLLPTVSSRSNSTNDSSSLVVTTDGSTGRISSTLLPDLSITNVYSKPNMTAEATSTGTPTGRFSQTTVEAGDIVIESGTINDTAFTKTWMYVGSTENDPTDDNNWRELITDFNAYARADDLTTLGGRVTTLEGYTHYTITAGNGLSVNGTNVSVQTATTGRSGTVQLTSSITGSASNETLATTPKGVVDYIGSTFISSGTIEEWDFDYEDNGGIYPVGTIVSRNGNFYRCLQPVVAGNNSRPENYPTIWEKIALYTFAPVTSSSAFGLAKVDNDTITSDDGVISVKSGVYAAAGSAVPTPNANSDAGKVLTVSVSNGNASFGWGTVPVDDSTIKIDSTNDLYAIGVYRGAYSSSKAYRINDIVSNDNGVFKMQKNVDAGVTASFPSMANASNTGTSSHSGITLIPAATTGKLGITLLNSTVRSSSTVETQAVTPRGVAEYVLKDVGGFSLYDSTKTYAVGDIVVSSGKLYKCKTAITTSEEWTSSKWQEVTESQPGVGAWRVGSYYVVGDLVYYNGTIYECRSANTATTSNTPVTSVTNNQNTWWKAYNKFTGSISGTASNSPTMLTVTHNLNTQELVVQVYKMEDGKRKPVLVDYFFGTTSDSSGSNAINNNITFEFASPQTNLDTYRVVIIAAK